MCVISCTSPLLYFCTVLHNCSNARVRYKISCWYSFICKQGLQLIFKPNSINCFVLARNTASTFQIRNATYQNVPKSLNYTLQYFFLHHQCLNCNNFQLFDVRFVRSRFSPCSGHRTVPKRSKFEGFRQPTSLSFTQNVHRDLLAYHRAQFRFESINRWTGGSLCTFCTRQSKAGRRKNSNFDRFGTVRWPEHGEKRDLTRRRDVRKKVGNCCNLSIDDEETKYWRV